MEFRAGSTALIYLIALSTGFIYPHYSEIANLLVLPALLVAFTFSLKDYSFDLQVARAKKRITLIFLFFSYVLSTLIAIVLAFLFLEGDLFNGFLLVAAVPPGIAVIGVSFLLKGDVRSSFFGVALGHLLAIAIVPLLLAVFLSTSVDLLHIVEIMALFVFVPFVLSRWMRFDKTPRRGLVVSSFFIIIYAAISANQGELLGQTSLILFISLLMAVRILIPFLLAVAYARWAHWDRRERTSLYLFSVIRNNGLALYFALALFTPLASLPAVVSIVLQASFVSLLAFYMKFK
ncbi:hypothetical protein KJ765_05875 [Candidatus Micrarchaeota archaeon]|nr:hypothetical protein [Candidatus Micrarchaeota archaeon]